MTGFDSLTGILTASGWAAVDRWLPFIRDNQPSILMELQCERRRKSCWRCWRRSIFALFVEKDWSDPVIAAVGIQGMATFELASPRHSYDGMVLLELIEKPYGENYATT